MPQRYDDDLRLAHVIADQVDALTLERFHAQDLRVETKPDLTPVTDADRAAEEIVRSQLARTRPRDAVHGEEMADTGHGPRRWIVDPIDGTKNYVRGVPVWATLIALQDGDQLTVGVVSAPALRRRWWAARGQGAFADSCAIHVSAVAELADAQLLWGGIEDWDAIGRADSVLALARRCWRTRGFGDFWQYMLVAEGAAEIALDPEVSVWDLAAPLAIVEEAGGRFTDLRGERCADGGSAVATNGLVHEAALRVLGR
jgi:histidinol-phosphatase